MVEEFSVNEICLFEESFSSFPLGPFPYDPEHSAMGEYHYFPSEGYTGRWYDPIANYSYKGPSWLVTCPALDGKKVMELSRIQEIQTKTTLPTLVSGDPLWQDYLLKAVLRPLSKDLPCGLLFRYQTSLMHYGLFFTSEGLEIHRVEKNERTILAKAPVTWSTDEFQRVSITLKGEEITVRHQEKELLLVKDGLYPAGGIALSACMPTQYASVEVFTSNEELQRLEAETRRIQQRVERKSKAFPQPRLIKQINLQDFGAGRQIRFGHLLGTKELFFVMAQHQRRVFKDRYPFISCLTAVSLETGQVLWQKGQGRDDGDVIELTTDLPFQVYDIDDDGFDEVIASWDFAIHILDGRTGEVKRKMATPLNEQSAQELCGVEFGHHAFERLNVDSIRIVNVTGKNRPSDLLIKDRYARLWIYDDQFNLVWKFTKNNTGHFPYAYDFNHDGKDEVFSCYNMIDSEGKLVWEIPIAIDHTDEIVIGPIDPEEEELIAIVAGWEGFMLLRKDGTILKREINGHGQRISVGNYLPRNPGMEICTTTFWGGQGIIYMHDCKGRELWSREMPCNGNVIAPVNWDGSGQDLLLLNAHALQGGLMDGEGDIVVRFPNDGHPELCCEVLNVSGDEREELILWDRKCLWVYTQDTEQPLREKTYLPHKYPMYNASNYRGEFSFPHYV
jgi:rhamnogalacturonan endolyase